MDALEALLQKHWHYLSFRPAQREIISASLGGEDVLALLPTGGGKSLCYQLPAVLREGLTLVISPLLALMYDQVSALSRRRIPAAVLAAGSGAGSVRNTLQAAARGTYKLLYISPERLATREMRAALPYLPVSAIAVDEAHCISQWGHDFRPDYLRIGGLREVFPHVPVAAFTATATALVEADIQKQLMLRDGFARFEQSYERPNIFYRVERAAAKPTALAHAIKQGGGPAIIYCNTRRRVEDVAKALSTAGLSALPYHAGLDAGQRRETQDAWMDGEVQVVAATTAFGMGIDRADVRLVVHYDAPSDLESFYQETGRAGRDGKPATALAFFEPKDGRKMLADVAKHFPPEAFLRRVYQAVMEYLQIPSGTEVEQYFPFDLAAVCQRFGLPKAEAASALRLLEAEGLWTMTDAVFRPATAHFLVDRQTYDAFAVRHPQLGIVGTALLRLYGGIFYKKTVIHLTAVAKLLRIRQEAVRTAFSKMMEAEILAFDESGVGAQLHVHHYRVESAHLLLDLEKLRTLREAAERRALALRDFLEDDRTCRTKRVLEYFGQSAKEHCGHCDVCAASAKRLGVNEIRKTLLDLFNDTPQSAAALIGHFPPTHRQAVTKELRQLLDEGLIGQRIGALYRKDR